MNVGEYNGPSDILSSANNSRLTNPVLPIRFAFSSLSSIWRDFVLAAGACRPNAVKKSDADASASAELPPVVGDMATADDDAPVTSVASHEDVLEFWFDGDVDVSARQCPGPAPPTSEKPPPPD